MRLVTVLGVVGLLLLGLAGVGYTDYHTRQQTPGAAASGVRRQIETAVTHAGFAAGGQSLAYVQQHLGHALNCIEGKGGRNFNAAWGHVCEGQGNGILTDLRGAAGGAAVQPLVEHADALAVTGVKTRDLTTARAAAAGVSALLKVAAEYLK